MDPSFVDLESFTIWAVVFKRKKMQNYKQKPLGLIPWTWKGLKCVRSPEAYFHQFHSKSASGFNKSASTYFGFFHFLLVTFSYCYVFGVLCVLFLGSLFILLKSFSSIIFPKTPLVLSTLSACVYHVHLFFPNSIYCLT